MGFTTLEFAVFYALFFVLYWFVTQGKLQLQNLLILIASYVFYGWWDWRFLGLIFISSLTDFLVGLGMRRWDDNARRRKLLLYVSLAVNLGMLGFFKYFNFFIDSFRTAFGFAGMDVGWSTLDIILPVGISFYTLQTLSYTFDVYRRKLDATDNVVNFFAYVSFFPQLVAGPIERAAQLLPQFSKARVFKYAAAADGARQVLWGLVKKMLIADNIAPYTHDVFASFHDYNGSALLIYLIMGTIQFYCDFSGYSDIAIGSARMLGFNLMKNFDYPFFSRNIAEVWQKWHISLITWIRDYFLMWLKGYKKWKLVRNIFVIFIVTGFWHGARWNFIVWGLMHALLFLPVVMGKRKKYRHPIAHNRMLPTWSEAFAMGRTFTAFMLVAIFFHSKSVVDGFKYWGAIFNRSLFSIPDELPYTGLFIIPFMMIEWVQREQDHGLDFTRRQIPTWVRWAIYFVLILTILFYGGRPSEFIYFQF